jgi:hypothetical protein
VGQELGIIWKGLTVKQKAVRPVFLMPVLFASEAQSCIVIHWHCKQRILSHIHWQSTQVYVLRACAQPFDALAKADKERYTKEVAAAAKQ